MAGPRLRWRRISPQDRLHIEPRSYPLDPSITGYSADQTHRLNKIRSRLVEARRELDALIGDAYLRPRASIVPVHFLDLASAVEKLRWAEKEWRELEQEITEAPKSSEEAIQIDDSEPHLRAVGDRN
jgi:hypothetical protein